MIHTWIRIVAEDDFEIKQDGTAEGAYKSIYYQSYYLNQYIILASVHIVFSSIVIISYFTFSSKINMFIEVMLSAKFEIIFFLVTFLINITIFALVAHILFGISEERLKTFSESMMTVFLSIVGEISPFKWNTTLFALKTIYGIVFVINKILILNIATAIITAHYIEFYIDSNGEENTIFKVS
jgi:hypothetical protein